MFEQKILAYILYKVLLEVRSHAYENGDKRTFSITQMVHNLPLSLLDEQSAKEAYKELLNSVEYNNAQDWLAFVQDGFSETK